MYRDGINRCFDGWTDEHENRLIEILIFFHPQIVLAVTQFVVVIIASIVIGFIAGCVASILSRFTDHIHG